MNKLEKINKEQRLYVMKCGDGFSCYGFDVLHDKAMKVHKWLGNGTVLPPVSEKDKGTVKHFRHCQKIIEAGRLCNVRTGRKCTADLVPLLKKLEGKRVAAIVYGELQVFTVGRSTGWMPCHLMIEDGCVGGSPIYKDSIQDIREV